VVHISARENNGRNGREGRMRSPFDLFFGEDFFSFPFEAPPRQGTGSGVIYSSDGYIITNNHVIEFADEVEVTLYNDETYPAVVIGVDPRTDLAVLRIETKESLPTLEFADSDEARVGAWVLAVGNPFELTSTVTAGIISAKGRDIDIIRRSDAIENFIQTDAAVNPGNSGGALVDTDGRLIGINTAIASPTGAFAGYSFAIPSNMVRGIVDNLIEFGAARGSLGVNVMQMDKELAQEMDVAIETGVFVESLEPSGAAALAGLLPYDVIIGVDKAEVKQIEDLRAILESRRVGDTLNITVIRRGKTLTLPVRLRAG
jgi:serine protease Do